MGKIQLLDSETINQIAAGEVIEHPASVIKELVENSIDAGATKLIIEIENGGQELMVITDNGYGMSCDDAVKALQRHATSKIRSHDDLSSLVTMGFRGEALAAIASISHLTLITAEKAFDAPLQKGVELVVEAGSVISCKEVQTFVGTQIRVRSLFYNVPARKKFQKAPFKDAQECLKCITQLALAHPNVQFEVISDKKKELNLAQHGLEERVKALLPAEFTSSMKQVSYKTPAIQIEGFVGDVASSRPNRTAQFLFLNRRPIQSLALSFAVKEAYGTLIDKERHPAFVLHIELQGDSVDVNVHPQKKEVRFRREYEIKKTLVEHVSAALFSKASTHKTCSPSLSCIASPVAFSFESPLFFEKSKAMQQSDEIVLPLAFTTFQIVGVWKEYIFAEISFDEAAPQKLQQAGLCIIDAKLALARIAFEDLGAIKETKVHSQILVNPLCIQMALHEAKQLSQLAPSLKNMGFEIREFGTSQFLVEAIPVTLDIVQVESFFHECMAEDGVDPVQQKRVIATAAARFSCLHKNGLTIDLAKEIIRRLLACQMPYQCPQGNAVFAHFTKDRMRKEFQ